MSNYVYTPVYPNSADVVAVGLQLAQRQSDGGSNAGITDNGNPALGTLGQAGTFDVAGKGTAYLQAIADVILSSTGFQVSASPTLGANNTSSITYVDVPASSFTFTAPIAKTYTVHCDFGPFFSAGVSPNADIALVINGNVGPRVTINDVNLGIFNPVHVMHAAACAAGSNTIKLQWRVGVNTFTVNTSGASYANYIVTG